MATILWDGGGDGVTLTQGANWAGDIVPGADDDAIINIAGTPTIQHAAGGFTVRSINCAETLSLTGGTFSLSGSITAGLGSTIAALAMSGGAALGGAGDATVTGSFACSGGSFDGPGRLILAPGSIGTLNGSVFFAGNLEIAGAFTWTAGNMFNTAAGGGSITILPGATFTINGTEGGSGAAIVNQGTIIKNGPGAIDLGGGGAPVTNVNTLAINAGILRLLGGGGNSGAITVADGAALEMSNGDFSHGNDGSIAGPGVLTMFGSGVHAISGLHTFDIVTNWQNGTLTGAGDAVFLKRLDWHNGTMSGSGDTVIAPTSQLRKLSGGTLTLSRTLVNNGVIDHSAGDVRWAGGTLINSAGRKYNLTGTAFFSTSSGGNLFTNDGVLNFAGSGTVVLPATLNSPGAINVLTGTLQLNGGGTHSGKRNVAAGSTLHYVGNYTHVAGSTLTGGGTTIWQGGTHTIQGGVTVSSFLHWTNITVTGGALQTNGPITWNSGSVQGTSLVTNPAGKITITTGGGHQLAGNITNNGTLIWNNGSLDFADGIITNNPGKFFFVLSGATAGAGGAVARVVNHGTMRKQLGTALSFGDVEIVNTGAIDVRNGSLTISGPALAQLSGNTLTGGGWSLLPTGDLFITGAEITTLAAGASVTIHGNAASFDALNTLAANNGTLTIGGGKVFTIAPAGGTFTNNGELICRKGSALRVLGDFVQSASGTLSLDISSATAAGIGRVIATGAATLGGTVTFDFVSGFSPAPGNAFVFVSAASRTGVFATESIPAVAGLTGSVQYLTGAARLRYT